MSAIEHLATLTLNTDPDDGRPLYQQLADQIRPWIRSGRLLPGERLPSSRKLALLLNLSRTSVLSAYDQLIAEGLVTTRPASGLFVSDWLHNGQTTNQPNPPAEPPQVASAEGRGVFDAGPDLEQFPYGEWSRSLGRVWRKPDPALLRDRHPSGYWPLRLTIAQHVKSLRGIDCDPHQILVTAGSRDALALLSKVLLRGGDTVALEDPCYPQLRHGLQAQSLVLQPCAVDEEGAQLPRTSDAVKLAWLTPARQYPLGTSMSTERRLQWLQSATHHNCWLIEDDYDCEFSYRKPPLAPLFQLDSQMHTEAQRRVIYVGSFSKLMFRTLRIGFLIVPPGLIEPVSLDQQRLGTLASVPIQPALADFISHRKFAAHLRRMRRCYQQRRDFLHALLNERLGDCLHSELPDRGMHLLARLGDKVAVDDVKLEQNLQASGVFAPALSSHYIEDGEQGLILGFSGTPEAGLEQGVRCLESLLRDL